MIAVDVDFARLDSQRHSIERLHPGKVLADRAGFQGGRLRLAGEQLFGGVLRIVRMGERRQRLGIDRTFVLRQRGDCESFRQIAVIR